MSTPAAKPKIGCFQWLLLGLTLVSLALSIGLAVLLLQGWTMGQLLITQVSTDLETLAKERIEYTVKVDQTVPIKTVVEFNEEVIVPIDLVISRTINISTSLPIPDDLSFPIATNIPFNETINVPINETVDVSNEVGIPIPTLAGTQMFMVPIKANIPIELDVSVVISRNIAINTDIPFQLPPTLDGPKTGYDIPIGLDIPVEFPVQVEVVVPINQAIPVDTEVPLNVDVPISIEISETPFGAYLQHLAQQLRQLSNAGPASN